MSRAQRCQNSSLSSPYSRKWTKIISHQWGEAWQMAADRDSRLSSHRSFEVDL